jgi:hypothetical protein
MMLYQSSKKKPAPPTRLLPRAGCPSVLAAEAAGAAFVAQAPSLAFFLSRKPAALPDRRPHARFRA